MFIVYKSHRAERLWLLYIQMKYSYIASIIYSFDWKSMTDNVDIVVVTCQSVAFLGSNDHLQMWLLHFG